MYIYTGKVVENYKKAIDNYEIDIFIPEFNLGVEFNGIYWHQTIYKKVNDKFVCCDGKEPSYHQNKSILARKKGIRLIHIWEDQWKDPRLQGIIKGILKAALHVSTEERIPARKCIIKKLDSKQYKEFCDKYHKLIRIKRSAKKYKEYMEAVVNKKLLCCYGAGNLKYIWKKD